MGEKRGKKRAELLSTELARVGDADDLRRPPAGAAHLFNVVQDLHPVGDRPKHDVLDRRWRERKGRVEIDTIWRAWVHLYDTHTHLSIEPGGLHRRDKELRPVGVGTRVRH